MIFFIVILNQFAQSNEQIKDYANVRDLIAFNFNA